MDNVDWKGVELLCGGIVRTALEDLFAKPFTKAPDCLKRDGESWLKRKNAEIEFDRVDALDWLKNGELVEQLELEPNYLVAQYYEANKTKCLSLYRTMQQFYTDGYANGKTESDTQLIAVREELNKTLAQLKEAKQTIADLKSSVASFRRKNEWLIKKQDKVKRGLEQLLGNKPEYKKVAKLLNELGGEI